MPRIRVFDPITEPKRLLMYGARPTTRAECISMPRPCPWVSCRFHLLGTVEDDEYVVDHRKVFDKRGTPDLIRLIDTCVLDVASNAQAIESRQIVRAKTKLLAKKRRAELLLEFEEEEDLSFDETDDDEDSDDEVPARYRGLSYPQIGKRLGMTGIQVREVEAVALTKLKGLHKLLFAGQGDDDTGGMSSMATAREPEMGAFETAGHY